MYVIKQLDSDLYYMGGGHGYGSMNNAKVYKTEYNATKAINEQLKNLRYESHHDFKYYSNKALESSNFGVYEVEFNIKSTLIEDGHQYAKKALYPRMAKLDLINTEE